MKLQIALDYDMRQSTVTRAEGRYKGLKAFTPELARRNLKESGADRFVDIIEIGTPFIYSQGMPGVRQMREIFPDKLLLADMKIADAGYYEAYDVFDAGADIVTVLAVSEDETIRGAVRAARESGKEIMADMLAAGDTERRISEIDALGVDYICLHTAKDLQKKGFDMRSRFMTLKGLVKDARLAVAGGIGPDNIRDYAAFDPDIVVVGEGITGCEDYRTAAEQIYEILLEYGKE